MKKLISLGFIGILLSLLPITSQAVDCDDLSNKINEGINIKTVSQQCSLIRSKSEDILTCADPNENEESQDFVFYPHGIAEATIEVCKFFKNNPNNYYTKECNNVIVTPSGTAGSNGNPSSSDCFVATLNFKNSPPSCQAAFNSIDAGVQSGNTILQQCSNVILKEPTASAISNPDCTSISIPFSEQTASDIKKLCEHYTMNPDSERTKKCGGLKVSFDDNSEAAQCNIETLFWLESCPAGQGFNQGGDITLKKKR